MAPSTNKGPSQGTRASKNVNQKNQGRVTELNSWPMLDWETVGGEAEHIADLSAKFTQSNVGHQGILNMTMAIPVAYAHAAVDTHLASQDGVVYIRVYRVSMESFRGARDVMAGDLESPDAKVLLERLEREGLDPEDFFDIPSPALDDDSAGNGDEGGVM